MLFYLIKTTCCFLPPNSLTLSLTFPLSELIYLYLSLNHPHWVPHLNNLRRTSPAKARPTYISTNKARYKLRLPPTPPGQGVHLSNWNLSGLPRIPTLSITSEEGNAPGRPFTLPSTCKSSVIPRNSIIALSGQCLGYVHGTGHPKNRIPVTLSHCMVWSMELTIPRI